MTLERKPIKQRKCKECRKPFIPDRQFIVWCSPECGAELAKKKIARANELKARKQRKEYREAKERIKSRGDWLREAQAVFNKWIRLRDAYDGCISCDKPSTWNGQWHASHFYATSIRPNLRFNEDNVHKSCSVCNNYMHGNLTPYRERLIEKIGIEKVNILDVSIEPAKYTIQDLKDLKAKYAKLTKDLQRKMQD